MDSCNALSLFMVTSCGYCQSEERGSTIACVSKLFSDYNAPGKKDFGQVNISIHPSLLDEKYFSVQNRRKSLCGIYTSMARQ